MKKIFLLFALLPFFVSAQEKTQLVGIATAAIEASTNEIHIAFTSSDGYTVNDIAINDIYTTPMGTDFIRYEITTVDIAGAATGFDVRLIVSPLDGYTGAFPTSIATIYRPQANSGLALYSDLSPARHKAAIFNSNTIKIDSLLGVGGFPFDTSGFYLLSNPVAVFNATGDTVKSKNQIVIDTTGWSENPSPYLVFNGTRDSIQVDTLPPSGFPVDTSGYANNPNPYLVFNDTRDTIQVDTLKEVLTIDTTGWKANPLPYFVYNADRDTIEVDTLPIFPVDTTGFAALTSPFVSLTSDGDSIIVKEAPSATGVPVDASAGAVALSLPTSTNTGSIRFYAGIDLTNAATLAPATGQTLNGVTDGIFTFSSYPTGTQFRADETNGGWLVTVSGSPTTTDLLQFSIQGILNDESPTATDGDWYVPIGDIVDNAVQPFHETDNYNIRTGNNLVIPTGKGGRFYDVSGVVLHPSTPISGSNNQSVFGVTNMVLRINQAATGTTYDVQLSLDSRSGTPDEYSGAATVKLDEGDTINLVLPGSNNEINEDFVVRLSLMERPGTETVLAGMLTPESVSSVGLFNDQVAAIFNGYEFRADATAQEFQMRVTTGTKSIIGFTSYDAGVGGQSTESRSLVLDQNWVPVWTDATLNMPHIGDFQRLYWSDGVSKYEFRGIVGSGYDNNFIEIRRLNHKEVVMPDAVPVEDVEVTLFDDSFDTNTTDISLSLNESWPNVLADYSHLRVTLVRSSDNWVASNNLFETSAITLTTGKLALVMDGAFVPSNFGIALINMSNDTTGSFTLNTTSVLSANMRLLVKGVKTQKTVINTTDTPVDDQSSSGYMDIGNMRIQWGRHTTSGSNPDTVTLPAPFADANYSVHTQYFNVGAGSGAFTTSVESLTTTSFDYRTFDPAGANGPRDAMWQAIGLKP